MEMNESVLVLRVTMKDLKSYGGFQWPELGPVEAPDWDPKPCCGGGLHGWLKGEGDFLCAPIEWTRLDDYLWQVVEVHWSDVVELPGKVKFRKGNVIFTGSRAEATAMLSAAYPSATVIAGMATAGDAGTATVSDAGTATAGNHGTATAGKYGKATAGKYGTATAGNHGTATAGNHGTAKAGDAGTATAGNAGTATAGFRGTATAGYEGTATAGNAGIIILSYLDRAAMRRRIVTGYIGENGLEPGKAYRLNNKHEFEEAPKCT